IKGRWELLAEITQPSHQINRIKHEFLRTLNSYFNGSCDKRVVEEAKQSYSVALSKHFKGDKSWFPLVFDFAFLSGSTIVGTATAGPPGVIIGFGIGLGGIAASHLWPGPQLLENFSTPDNEGWFSQLPNMDDASSISSLIVDRDSVTEHMLDIEKWRID
ncbi:hypothetical protein ACFLWR_00685, partial [Chloroflexota bacterium]